MTKQLVFCNGQKIAAAAAVVARTVTCALFVGSLLVIPAHPGSNQKLGKFDSTVNLENSGIGSVRVMNGTPTTNVGSATAE